MPSASKATSTPLGCHPEGAGKEHQERRGEQGAAGPMEAKGGQRFEEDGEQYQMPPRGKQEKPFGFQLGGPRGLWGYFQWGGRGGREGSQAPRS